MYTRISKVVYNQVQNWLILAILTVRIWKKNVVISGVIYDRLYKTEWPSDEPIGGNITCCLVKTKGSLKTKYLPDIKNLEENK